MQPYKMEAKEFGKGTITWTKSGAKSDYPHFMVTLAPGIIQQLGGLMCFNIIVKSLHPKVRICVKEIPHLDMFSGEIRHRFDKYHQAYIKEMPDPFDVSSEDLKKRGDIEWGNEGTYGEVVFEHFAQLLQSLHP